MTTAATTTEARHSMASPDWQSPPWLVELARHTLGVIDLDPASDVEANEIVRAGRIYTKEDDGLALPWFGNVFINPPGGLVTAFWERLTGEWFSQRFEAGIWVGYSLEQLQTLQQSRLTDTTPMQFPMCIPKRRIAFVENEAAKAARVAKIIARGQRPDASARAKQAAADCLAGKPPKNAPSHANYITYLGRRPHRFAELFREVGTVRL